MSVDEILAQLQEIIAAAGSEPLTEAQATEIEELERSLAAARKDVEIRSRVQNYNALVTPRPEVRIATDAGLEARFQSFLRTGDKSLGAEFRAQGEASPAAGGYLVPNTYRDKIVECLYSYGGVAAEAETYSSSDGTPVSWVTVSDGVGDAAIAAKAGITPEAAEFTFGGDLVFGEAILGAYKYTTTGAGSDPLRVSVELLQDSRYDLDGLIRRHFAERIGRAQARHWATGTGVGQPQGILTGTADAELTTSNSFANAANGYAKLLSIVTALDTQYLPNAKWVMNKATWADILSIVDTTGRPLIQENQVAGIGSGIQKTLLGFPVVIDESFPSAAQNVNFLVFGDIRRAYVVRRVANLSVVVNPWTRAEFGQVEYTGWERADGVVQDRCAYILVKGID